MKDPLNTIRTPRLLLRPWKEEDLEPLVRLNSDPRVIEFLLGPLTLEESAARLSLFTKHLLEKGWGIWAIAVPGVSDFIGWIGLWPIGFKAHFTPAVEIAWRLLPQFWGQGYATEGAKACLQFGFETLKLDEIIAMTVPGNLRSRHVMEKLGMHCEHKDDFEHPLVPEGHSLKKHVLYRIKKKTLFS